MNPVEVPAKGFLVPRGDDAEVSRSGAVGNRWNYSTTCGHNVVFFADAVRADGRGKGGQKEKETKRHNASVPFASLHVPGEAASAVPCQLSSFNSIASLEAIFN